MDTHAGVSVQHKDICVTCWCQPQGLHQERGTKQQSRQNDLAVGHQSAYFTATHGHNNGLLLTKSYPLSPPPNVQPSNNRSSPSALCSIISQRDQPATKWQGGRCWASSMLKGPVVCSQSNTHIVQVWVSLSHLQNFSQILAHRILRQTREPSLEHRRCSSGPMTTVSTYLIISHPTQKLPLIKHCNRPEQFRENTLGGWGDTFENTEYALNQRPQRYWDTMFPRRIHVVGKQGMETELAVLTIIPVTY